MAEVNSKLLSAVRCAEDSADTLHSGFAMIRALLDEIAQDKELHVSGGLAGTGGFLGGDLHELNRKMLVELKGHIGEIEHLQDDAANAVKSVSETVEGYMPVFREAESIFRSVWRHAVAAEERREFASHLFEHHVRELAFAASMRIDDAMSVVDCEREQISAIHAQLCPAD